jgi:hypothetical protein
MLGILTSRTSTYLRNLGAKKKKNKKKTRWCSGVSIFQICDVAKTSNHPHEDLAKFGYRYENIL